LSPTAKFQLSIVASRSYTADSLISKIIFETKIRAQNSVESFNKANEVLHGLMSTIEVVIRITNGLSFEHLKILDDHVS